MMPAYMKGNLALCLNHTGHGRDMWRSCQATDLHTKLHIALDIARGVAALHRTGVVHAE